jgi:hypothetical protein
MRFQRILQSKNFEVNLTMTVVSHNLMNVAHKVSDHHFHHEGH